MNTKTAKRPAPTSRPVADSGVLTHNVLLAQTPSGFIALSTTSPKFCFVADSVADAEHKACEALKEYFDHCLGGRGHIQVTARYPYEPAQAEFFPGRGLRPLTALAFATA